ncbi:MAG TPA: tail fiber domain-containing protein [Prolixibacteraceae bacterium]|nr:tail fiber domain-containing protein [Prolixibacteraceae bacterium]
MKSLLLFALFVFCWGIGRGQVPQSFKYQAVARDALGSVIANQTVSFRISIVPGSATSGAVFSETHTKSTNSFGLIDLEIGNGIPVIGSFAAIDWSSGVFFVRVEMDPAGGNAFQQMGTSPLLSVPYAQHARTVEDDRVDDADSDPVNELQELSLSGNNLTLSGGGGTIALPLPEGDGWGEQVVATNASLSGEGTPASPLAVDEVEIHPLWENVSGIPTGFADNTDNVADADSDPANELQTLNLSGNQLTLSNGGGTVSLPVPEGGDNWGTQTVVADASLSGNGTEATPLKLASRSATIGQVLKWDGSAWLPGNDADSPCLWTLSGENLWLGSGKVGVGVDPGATARKLQSLTGNELALYAENNSATYPAFAVSNNGTALAALFSSYGTVAAQFDGKVVINDGTQANGNVLTSDENGQASWQAVNAQWEQEGDGILYTNKKVGIGTDEPAALLHVDGTDDEEGGGNVLFSGTFSGSPHDPAATGAGTRMMWYPDKAAFRAGHVTDTLWDKNNIGYYSVAINRNTKALGMCSFAANELTVASGQYSTALGYSTTAIGNYSLAVGFLSRASGITSFSSGQGCTSSGYGSFATGYQTAASASYSFAAGSQTTASGLYSASFGNNSSATGTQSFACGDSHATGNSSFSAGSVTTASGGASAAFNYYSTASGIGSFAMGYHTSATGSYSTAMGNYTTSSGNYSISGGLYTSAVSYCETVFGAFSTTYTGSSSGWALTDRIFAVGNGTSLSSRSNALTILKNGNVGIGTDMPTYDLAVVGNAAKTGGGSWTSLSDRRLKEIDGDYEKGLKEIVALKPVRFHYKSDNPFQLPSDVPQIGFIAQEVQPVFPEAVSENEAGYLDFNMHPLHVAMVNAIQELKAENDRLRAACQMLEERMNRMEEELEK